MTTERVSNYQFVDLDPQLTVAVRLVRPMEQLDIGALFDSQPLSSLVTTVVPGSGRRL